MNEERMAILNMIAQGTLTPEEGEKLLRALDEGDAKKQFHRRPGGSPPPPEPDDFDNRRDFRDDTDWERGFESFMDGFGRKMEKFAESFGGDFEKKAEMMAEDLAVNLGKTFGFNHSSHYPFTGHFRGSTDFKGIPIWGLEGGLDGEEIDISSGEIDVTMVKGVVILSPNSGTVDIRIHAAEEGESMIFDPRDINLAVNKDGWIILEFNKDGDIAFPVNVVRLGVFIQHGDICINVPLPDLVASTVNGDLFISRLCSPALVKTINGNITLEAEKSPAGKIDLSTINGDIKCHVPSSLSLDFTLKTVQGAISASGSGITVKGGYDRPGNHLKTGTLGGVSEGSLLISSIQGDIVLESVE